MQQAGMIPPTFESQHSANEFTSRLLLHHFLSEEDIKWLAQFERLELNEDQKKALVFVREVGAIDNFTYRQLSGCDILKASGDLRMLKQHELLEAKGKGRATYYIAGDGLVHQLSAPVAELIEPVSGLIEPVPGLTEPVSPLSNQLPDNLRNELSAIGKRTKDKEAINQFIVHLCAWKPLKLSEIASIMGRRDKHLLYTYITPLRESGRIEYTIPDMPNHPEQGYKAKN